MERTITIKYNWKQENGSEVKEHHVEYLEESADTIIHSQITAGFREGELLDCLCTGTDETSTTYKGWWSVLMK